MSPKVVPTQTLIKQLVQLSYLCRYFLPLDIVGQCFFENCSGSPRGAGSRGHDMCCEPMGFVFFLTWEKCFRNFMKFHYQSYFSEFYKKKKKNLNLGISVQAWPQTIELQTLCLRQQVVWNMGVNLHTLAINSTSHPDFQVDIEPNGWNFQVHTYVPSFNIWLTLANMNLFPAVPSFLWFRPTFGVQMVSDFFPDLVRVATLWPAASKAEITGGVYWAHFVARRDCCCNMQ